MKLASHFIKTGLGMENGRVDIRLPRNWIKEEKGSKLKFLSQNMSIKHYARAGLDFLPI